MAFLAVVEVEEEPSTTRTRKAHTVKSSRADTRASFHKIPEIEFSDDGHISSYSGLVLFQALFQTLDLKARLRRCFFHLRRHAIYDLGSVTLLLITHVLLGFRGLRGLGYYHDDPLVRRLLGLRRLPDVATVSRALRRVDDKSIASLREVMRTMVTDRLGAQGLRRVTLDFDGSVQSTTGHAEGTAVGFNKVKKGARSYYPLFCTVAQTGQFFDLHHRSGNVHDSKGAPEFMMQCFIEALKHLGRVQLESRFDAAFYSDEIFDAMETAGAEFACSVPFQRFSEMKGLIEKRKRWTRIDDEWSCFEKPYKAQCWNREYRFIFLRVRRARRHEGPLQLDLFEPKNFEYEYKVIATNKKGSAGTVLAFHNGRGSQERIFGEAKQHAALDLIPTRTKRGNQVYTLCAMLAHNLARELQMSARMAERRTTPKRETLWRFLELGTIRQRLIHRAGMLLRPQGRLTLRMSANEAVQSEMTAFLEALAPQLVHHAA